MTKKKELYIKDYLALLSKELSPYGLTLEVRRKHTLKGNRFELIMRENNAILTWLTYNVGEKVFEKQLAILYAFAPKIKNR